MGAAQSRQDDDFFMESGVRVTQGLLEQLDGRRRSSGRGAPPAAAGAGAPASLAVRPRADADADALAAAREDRSLARALDRSRRVGSMLLKAEEGELEAVGALADELVAREFAAPSRPRPCQPEAAECVRCYAENGADPLACAPAVDAYSRCARAAWQEALQRAV